MTTTTTTTTTTRQQQQQKAEACHSWIAVVFLRTKSGGLYCTKSRGLSLVDLRSISTYGKPHFSTFLLLPSHSFDLSALFVLKSPNSAARLTLFLGDRVLCILKLVERTATHILKPKTCFAHTCQFVHYVLHWG